MSITIYSKSGCPECVFTKKFLEAENIPFNEKRIDLDQNYFDEVVGMGYHSLPVIRIDEETSFNGYKPKKLQRLVEQWQR